VKYKRSFSPVLGWTGVATMAVGAALMVPWKTETGAEDYNIYGEDVCIVSDYNNKFDAYDGQCDTTEPMIKAGLITMGIGGALAFLGFHKVTVSPQLGHKVMGAKVSVKW
jgi:hypothetical protein